MALLQMLQAVKNAQPEWDLQHAMTYGTQAETPGVQSIGQAAPGVPQASNPYDKSLQNARASQYQAPPAARGMDFGTKDLIAGALPLVLALFAGKNGAEFAGSYAQNYLSGKQKGVDRENENRYMAWQAGQGQRDAAVRNAELDSNRWERTQDQAAELAFKREQMNAKDGPDDKMARELRKKLFDPDTDPKAIPGIIADLASLGFVYSPEVVEGLKKGSYKVDAAKAKTEGQTIKNEFDKQANPVKLEGLKFKNQQTKATIQNLEWRSMQIKKMLPGKVQALQAKYAMDDAHAAVYAATALTIGPKAEADIAKSLAVINNLNSLSDSRVGNLDAKSQATVNASLNSGLSTLSAQINTKENALRILTTEMVTADDQVKPELIKSIKSLEGELQILKASYSDLANQAAALREKIGLNADGTRKKTRVVPNKYSSPAGPQMEKSVPNDWENQNSFRPLNPNSKNVQLQPTQTRVVPNKYSSPIGPRMTQTKTKSGTSFSFDN